MCVSGWERPKRVLHLHLYLHLDLHAWRRASTLERHSGVMNVPSVSEDMSSHLLMKELECGAESAPKFRRREGKWSRRKQSAGRNE